MTIVQKPKAVKAAMKPQCPTWCRHRFMPSAHPRFSDHVHPGDPAIWLHASTPIHVGSWKVELTADTHDDETRLLGAEIAVVDEATGTAVDINLGIAAAVALAIASTALEGTPGAGR